MSKISLIIKREYVTRVRKRSFVVMTLLGPLLFAGFMILPNWLSQMEDPGVRTIAVVEYDSDNQPVADSVQFFKHIIPNNDNLRFSYLKGVPLDVLLDSFEESPYYGILVLHHDLLMTSNRGIAKFYAKRQPSMGEQLHITKSLEEYISNVKLIKNNIPPDLLKSLQSKVKLQTIKLGKDGFKQEELLNLKRGVGYATGFLLYFFILFFGSQVMRGIIEEKNNRILEVIVSSVKPFQLMMGKIIGTGLVGLTQFLAWVVLTIAISSFAHQALMPASHKNQVEQLSPENLFESKSINPEMQMQPTSKDQIFTFLNELKGVDFMVVLSSFLIYFLGGFLLYGSLFAAIGAIVDPDTDTQQFIFPVTIPLILSIIVMFSAITNPEGQVAFWFSIIPFTSPVVMMARIPFGVPYYQVILSMGILALTFIGTVWLAGKIYRTGILMYGKKTTYKELWKWIRYKN